MSLLHDLIVAELSGGGGGSITVDSELSPTSTNPVQNKVIAAAGNAIFIILDDKADKVARTDINGTTDSLAPFDNSFTNYINPLETLTVSLTNLTSADYFFALRFHSGSTATVLTMPSAIKMPDGFEVEANKTYEINVMDGYALVSEWPYTAGGAA